MCSVTLLFSQSSCSRLLLPDALHVIGQLVLQICGHELGLTMHGDRWGHPKTEVECDYRTRSGPWQFKSGKFVGLPLPGKPHKSSRSQSSWVYKLSPYVQEHEERTSFLVVSHRPRQDTAMTGHEMLRGDLINTTHQKTQSTDCRIQTHINK